MTVLVTIQLGNDVSLSRWQLEVVIHRDLMRISKNIITAALVRWRTGRHTCSVIAIPWAGVCGSILLGIPRQNYSLNCLPGIAAICSFQHAIWLHIWIPHSLHPYRPLGTRSRRCLLSIVLVGLVRRRVGLRPLNIEPRQPMG